MSQTGHDPHGYNPVIYQRHNLGAISLAIGVNTNTSNQLINVSNKTRSKPYLLQMDIYYKYIGRYINRCTDRQSIGRYTDRYTDRYKDRCTYI